MPPKIPRFEIGRISLPLFYLTFYQVQGALTPFLAPWLVANGINNKQAGFLISLLFILKIFSNPLAACWVNAKGKVKPVLLLLSVLATIGYGVCASRPPSWIAVFALICTSALTAPFFPLADRLALGVGIAGGKFFSYKRVWGSVGFLFGTLLAGSLVLRAGSDRVMLLIFIGSALSTISLFPVQDALPATRVQGRQMVKASSLGLWSTPLLRFSILSAALTQASNAYFYSMSTVSWSTSGLSTTQISMLWVVGISAEILVFLIAPSLLKKCRPSKLLAWAAGLTIIRWAVIGSTNLFPILALAQVLQGATIGASGAAFAALVAIHAREQLKTSALTSHRVLGNGVFLALAGFIAVLVEAEFPSCGFFTMVPVATAATLVAVLLIRRGG